MCRSLTMALSMAHIDDATDTCETTAYTCDSTAFYRSDCILRWPAMWKYVLLCAPLISDVARGVASNRHTSGDKGCAAHFHSCNHLTNARSHPLVPTNIYNRGLRNFMHTICVFLPCLNSRLGEFRNSFLCFYYLLRAAGRANPLD